MNFHTVSRQPKNPDLRVSGRSAVAAVAYALTTSLRDERLGKTFNYAHGKQAKAKETRDLGLYFPGGKRIFQKARDNQGAYSEFWSKVELAEKRKDARTARTIVVALPVEMNQQEHENCLEKFQGYLASEYGMASQIGIHYDHEHNPHAHIVTTTRKVDSDGKLGDKIRVLDSARTAHFELKKIGEAWANFNNEILTTKYGISITHKSFKEQGIDKPKGEHLGPYHWRKRQEELAEIEEERARLEKELYVAIQHENRVERGTIQRSAIQRNNAFYGGNRKPNSQERPEGLQREDQRSDNQRSREIDPVLSQADARQNGIRDHSLEDGSNIFEAHGSNGNRVERNQASASGLSSHDTSRAGQDVAQAGSNHGGSTPTTKRSLAGTTRPDRQPGRQVDSDRDIGKEEEILGSLAKLDATLTMLADKIEIEQVRQTAEPDLFIKIDHALDAMQTKFDMEYLRGEQDGQAARADEAESESGNQIHFRLS